MDHIWIIYGECAWFIMGIYRNMYGHIYEVIWRKNGTEYIEGVKPIINPTTGHTTTMTGDG
jgi:hypothetical protein